MTLHYKGVLSAVPSPPTVAGVYHLFVDETADDYFFQTKDDIFSLTGRWSSENTFERTGFVDRSESTLAFSDSSPDRTFTITPTGAGFSYLIKDRLYTVTAPDSIQIPPVEGRHYIYYDGDTLSVLTNPTLAQIRTLVVEDNAFACVVYWDADNSEAVLVGDERHGAQMSGATHWWLHRFMGTRWADGCALNTLSTGGSGDLDIHAQFGVDAGDIEDEDIELSLSAVLSTVGLPIFYKAGAAGYWRRDFNPGFSIQTAGTGRAAWNEQVGGVWQKSEVGNIDYVLYHIWAGNDITYPYFSVMGQATYNTLPEAQEGALTEISNIITEGLPFLEFTPIATVIVETANTKDNGVKSSIEKTDEGDDYLDWRFSGLNPSTASPANHNNLAGLQGGSAGEFYHHTAQQWNTNNIFAYESGVLSGGNLTVDGGDNSKLDIAAGTGQIVDRTDPTVPIVTPVAWDAFDAVTLTNLATDEITGIFINSSAAVVQRTTTTVSDVDFRQMIFLGLVFHTNNTSITSILPEPSLAYGAGEDFREYMTHIGHTNLNGNVYSANGVNLYIDRTAGQIWATGSNFHTSPNFPSTKSTASATVEVFDIAYNDGSGGLDIETSQTTAINPDRYNPGGAGTSTAVGVNKWTIQRIYFWANGETIVMLGEEQYNRAEDALAEMETEVSEEPYLIAQFGILRSYLVVKQGATDLSDPTEAIFEEATNSAGGGAGGDTGENNVLVNVGTSGTSIVEGKDGVELQVRSIDGKAASGISTAYNATTKAIEIDYTGGGGTSGLPKSYIEGFGTVWLSNTSVRVYPGSCRSDDNTTDIASTINLDAAFGSTGAGGLDTGSESGDTSYHIWIIYNPTTTIEAAMISLSSTAPTMPSGYTKKRRVGSFYNDGSSNIAKFRVEEYHGFRWVIYDRSWQVLTGGVSETFTAVSCSPECPSTARMVWMNSVVTGSGEAGARLVEDGADTSYPIYLLGEGADTQMSMVPMSASQQVAYRIEDDFFDELDLHVRGYLEKV